MTTVCPKMFWNLVGQVVYRGCTIEQGADKEEEEEYGLRDGKAPWPDSQEDLALTPTNFGITSLNLPWSLLSHF